MENMSEDNITWRGVIEKRGNDVIRRWLNREVVLRINECEYYDPSTGEIRGKIPLTSATSIHNDDEIIEIITAGRPDKSKEANGRTFEFRVKDPQQRSEFLTALNKTLERACLVTSGVSSSVEEFGLQPDLTGFDHDDVLSLAEQTPSAAALIKDEVTTESNRTRIRRAHSNHEMGEDEYIDLEDFESPDDDEDAEGEQERNDSKHSPGDSKDISFYKSAKMYVSCMNAVDSAWEAVCQQEAIAMAASPAASPASPSGRKKGVFAGSPREETSSSPRRASLHSNPILKIKGIPLHAHPSEYEGDSNVLRAVLQCDPDEDFITTIDDLYACAQLAKPTLDAILQEAVANALGDESLDPENDITVESRMLTPHDATDSLQRCSVHSSASSPGAAMVVPSDASFLPPNVIPESCLSNIVSASMTCTTADQISRVVEELSKIVDVIFLDNRFLHPLGQPPTSDTRSLAVQAVFYNGSYQRNLRLLLSVPYPECDSGFQCELIINLAELRNASKEAMGLSNALDETSNSASLPIEQRLAPYFTRFRSWCSHRSDTCYEDAEEEEEARQMTSVVYSREVLQRADLLRQLTAMTLDEFSSEVDVFLDDIASEAYDDDPAACDGGYFLQLLQETRASRDLVSMRSVSSLFFDMELFGGSVALQRDIVEICREKYTDDSGEVGSSNALDSLCYELETLANLLMRDDSDEGVYESIQLLEESINMRETFLQISEAEIAANSSRSKSPRNISSLVSAMMLLGSLYDEHGVPSQAITALLGAQEACAAHPGNEKSLALVMHNLGLMQEQEGNLENAAESLEDAVELQSTHFGTGHPVRASTLLDLAVVYLQLGRVSDALRVGKVAMTARVGAVGGLLMSNPILADAMMALVPIYNAAGQHAESKAYIEKSLAIRKEFVGKEHTSIADCFVEYGMVCRYRADYTRARSYFEFALKLYYKLLGQRSAEVANTLGCLAGVLELGGDKTMAMDMYKLAVKVRRDVNGAESSELAQVLLLLANLCVGSELLDEAETAVQESITIQQSIFPSIDNPVKVAGTSNAPDGAPAGMPIVLVQHSLMAESASLMASICKSRIKYNDARRWYQYAIDVVKVINKDSSVSNDIAIIMTSLAIVLKEMGQLQEAVTMYEEALAIRRKLFKGQSPYIAQSLNNLAVVRKDMGQQAEAKRLFEDAVRMYVACNNNSEDSAEVAAAYNNLAGCLHDMDPNSPGAEKFGKLCVSIAERVLGNEHPTTLRYKENWSDYLSKTKSIYLKSSSTGVCTAGK